MTRENSRNENIKVEYISLQEATKYCPYSQEYLSLRARQGKLKAIKIGRNWVTKKEWVKEYLQEMDKFATKKRIAKNKFSSHFWEKEYPKPDITKAKVQRKKTNLPYKVLPNKVLPMGRLEESDPQYKKESLAGKGTKKEKNFFFSPSFKTLKPLLAIFLLALICAIGFFAVHYRLPIVKQGGEKVFLGVQDLIKEARGPILIFSENFLQGLKVIKKSFASGSYLVRKNFKSFLANLTKQDVTNNLVKKISNSISRFFRSFTYTLNSIFSNIKTKASRLFQKLTFVFRRKKIISPGKISKEAIPSSLSKSSEKGLVVLPQERVSPQTIADIQKSFSDEVRVKPRDEMTGIIIPIFRKKEAQRYIYILVPLETSSVPSR